jgi:hypothetical protein
VVGFIFCPFLLGGVSPPPPPHKTWADFRLEALDSPIEWALPINAQEIIDDKHN